jgi:hypothetical protein
MVGAGVKTLALSAPLEPEAMDELMPDAERIVADHDVQLYRETDFLVTDLFSADLTQGKHVLLIYRGDTQQKYLDLKAAKQRLIESDSYVGPARIDIARRFGRLLSYSEDRIAELLEAKATPGITRVYPLPGDVVTLDGIIDAYYEVVSGPAGESPDRRRDESLHVADALIAITGVDSAGDPSIATMTLGGYHDRFGGPRQSGFYEREIHRITQRFGNMAQVWSTYAITDSPEGPELRRGINSIQLYHDGERWWITSWIYDNERDGTPIPSRYLPQ